MLVIGDIAGQYKTLVALLKKCPDRKPISLGDMIDRGPDSQKVLDFFMTTDGAEAIKGNHEHFLESFYFGYDYYPQRSAIWFEQGGIQTLKSFNPAMDDGDYSHNQLKEMIPTKYVTWIKNLPLYKEIDGFFLSHAPLRQGLSLDACCDLGDSCFIGYGYSKQMRDYTIIWNRDYPAKIENRISLFGHCSNFGYRHFDEFAICLDSTRQNILTAIEIPSMRVYQQNYI